MSSLLSLLSFLCSLFWIFNWFLSGSVSFGFLLERILSPSYFFICWQSESPDFSLVTNAVIDRGLDAIPDFAYSGDPQALLRTDVILIGHWWIALLIGLHGKLFLFNLQGISWLSVYTLLRIAYVWFGKLPRKPPDRTKSVPCMILDYFYEYFPRVSFVIWHLLHPLGRKGEREALPSTTATTVPQHFLGKRRRQRHYHNRIIYSNVLLSLSTIDITKEAFCYFGSRTYSFVLDTGTSDHVCKDRELFINEPTPCPNVQLRGVSGTIQASGIGSIKFRIRDDDGKSHDLIIHDVIYVPECPINLISPQLLSSGPKKDKLQDAGLLTFQDTTIFFWDTMTYTKTIHHQAEVGIPILHVNEDFDNNALFSKSISQICHPCNSPPSYFQTSAPHIVEDDHGTPHVIPNDEGANIDLDDIPLTSEQQSVHVIPLDNDDDVTYSATDDLFYETDSENEAENIAPSIPVATAEHPSTEVQIDDGSVEADIDESLQQFASVPPNPQVRNLLDQLHQQQSEPMSENQREYLRIHSALNHLPHNKMKRLAESNVIPKKFKNMKPPLCAACIFGKQHKRPWRGKGSRNRIRRENHNSPGACVSTDQLISTVPGLIPQVRGILMKAKFTGATIFVDHCTDFTYVHLMKTNFTGQETVEAKHAWERKCAEYQVRIRRYHCDNGRYAETLFRKDVKDNQQSMTFCGVGSHHQNGIAEKKIRDLSEQARTMLAHATKLWPEAVDLSLWPYALKAAERTNNCFYLDKNGLCPEEKFSRLRHKRKIRDEHPLFCPVYVLDSSLQGAGSIPKWEPRSRCGVYLGLSPEHASSVALVLDLKTGHVSPQYHVIFDDTFSTVEHLRQDTHPPNWIDLAKYHYQSFIDSPHIPNIFQEWTANATPPPDGNATLDLDLDLLAPPTDDENLNVNLDEPLQAPVAAPAPETIVPPPPDPAPDPGTPPRRSQRSRKPSEKLKGSYDTNLKKAFGFLCDFFVDTSDDATHFCYSTFKSAMNSTSHLSTYKLQRHQEIINMNADGTMNMLHPLHLSASTISDNDVYYFHEAMREPDRADFIRAMIAEINDHTTKEHWQLVERSTIGEASTIKAIWSFKRKRRPDGSVLKHKARLCAHGGMQVHGETYWDTYAPVVNWMSVRIMLTLSVLQSLHTRSIDFTLAFPQAECETEIFMELPVGVNVPEGGDYVLLLLRNLYGLKQGSKCWFECLRDGLIEIGFTPSAIDPCIYYRNGLTLLTFVDDCLIFCEHKSEADALIAELETNFILTDEGEVSTYLGVKVSKDSTNGSITLTQPFLIQRIITALGSAVTNANTKRTPAQHKVILSKDEYGPARKQLWNYRSVIGMLNYLAASTRPDILFAVHQCARFSSDPKLCHEQGVKRIVRYLKGTLDQGLILTPDSSRSVECYVDADFAGSYKAEDADKPVSVLSRTGYTIYFKGCPIIWVSKMQTEITLSTTEAEYVALSQSMRDVIPFMNIVDEINSIYQLESDKAQVLCTLFEDNNGAIELAKAPKYRPRTKHIALKYHHFREHVKNGLVEILPIDTADQIADIFTKALDEQSFVYLRKKLNGW